MAPRHHRYPRSAAAGAARHPDPAFGSGRSRRRGGASLRRRASQVRQPSLPHGLRLARRRQILPFPARLRSLTFAGPGRAATHGNSWRLALLAVRTMLARFFSRAERNQNCRPEAALARTRRRRFAEAIDCGVARNLRLEITRPGVISRAASFVLVRVHPCQNRHGPQGFQRVRCAEPRVALFVR